MNEQKKYSFKKVVKKGVREIDEKKRQLKEAARQIFFQKGYKHTNIAEITKKAGMAVGSFYKYFSSKEAIFLDTYIEENESVRKKIIEEIDWKQSPIEVVDDLFKYTFQHTASNKILSEWNNEAVSDILRQYYKTKGGGAPYAMQFIMQKFRDKLLEANFDEISIEKILGVCDLIYYMDITIPKDKIENYEETVQILVKYFVHGIFASR